MVYPPGTPYADRREIDAPLSWFYLAEDPVPTGSSPEVIVGAELPCGYRPVFGDVSDPVSPLRVRLHAVYAGNGTPGSERCATPNRAAQFISLHRLRLGTFAIVDAVAHQPGDPPAPTATLHVVRDDDTLAPVDRRRWRACSRGGDEACTAGGVCGTVPGAPPEHGVCVPPMDPFLAVGRPCNDHFVDFVLSAGEPARDVHVCLPPVGPASSCPVGLHALVTDAASPCVP